MTKALGRAPQEEEEEEDGDGADAVKVEAVPEANVELPDMKGIFGRKVR